MSGPYDKGTFPHDKPLFNEAVRDRCRTGRGIKVHYLMKNCLGGATTLCGGGSGTYESSSYITSTQDQVSCKGCVAIASRRDLKQIPGYTEVWQ